MRLNVRTGRETLDAFAIRPAREARRIMVIGGGPSGMEAARVAALRGHRVELWDDRPRLGGRLRLAAVPAAQGALRRSLRLSGARNPQTGRGHHLNAAVTEVELDSRKPDAVILATGSVPFVPPIQGCPAAGPYWSTTFWRAEPGRAARRHHRRRGHRCGNRAPARRGRGQGGIPHRNAGRHCR